ncbi:MAG: hypothetical protein NC200_07005 [Candidatus Gastranaerophilales bacterium]|nr:hypothetical protein [Candidatus Gastranaerophilales bacterium]
MKVNTIGCSFGAKSPKVVVSVPKKISAAHEHPIKVVDVLPAATALGAGLMAAYFIKGGKLNKLMHNRFLEKLSQKSDLMLQNHKNHDLYTNKSVQSLKKGFTKVVYTGEKDGQSLQHVILFDKTSNPVKQVRSIQRLEYAGEFPIGYKRRTEIFNGGKHKSFIETNFYLDMKPKDSTVIRNGNKRKIYYGYDINKEPSGIAYTEGDKIAVRYNDSRQKIKKYNTIEEAFNSENRDDFRKL